MSKTGVSVVVPVYNNAATLPELCRRIRAAVSDRPLELVLVDDGSTDGSHEIIEHLGARTVRHPRNRGQNAAILSGLTLATQPVACVLDADLEDPPEAIPLLLSRMDAVRARVAFASREEARPLTSRLFRWAVRYLFPSLPPYPCLFFAIDEAGRAALVALARHNDYLPAVIGSLGLPSTQAIIARGSRPANTGRSGYAGLRRVRHGIGMLAASLRVRWRRAAGRQ